jgi:hypothetical protein
MSDLHRAVEDEIDAFRPDRTPPFGALMDRHRARNRRRYATGAAAVSAVAVAGIVFVPSALSGGADRLPSYADSEPTQAPTSDLAARLCTDAAQVYDGEVAAAYGTSVQTVRDYIVSQRAEQPPSIQVLYPTGWAEQPADDPAAACYIDAAFPAPAIPGAVNPERALILVTEGADPYQAAEGTKENLPPTPLTEPTSQAPDPFAPSETRYSIRYDGEAVYNRQVDAVQSCLGLPGVSVTGERESLPPVVGVEVLGFPKDRAFQDCMSSLSGVTLTALILYDPTTAPDAFINRSRLPSCGQHVVGHGSVPRAAIDCFAAALGSDAGAEYAVSRLSEEGQPTVLYYRALPGQQVVEVFLDTTRDSFGKQQWLQAMCTGYDPTGGHATGCPPNGTGQI